MNAHLFAQLTKVDEETRLVYGRAADETPDRSNEIFDYVSSKPYFEKWSGEVAKSSGGKSVGNVRAMHGNVAAGVLKSLEFDDANKAIDICAHIVDDQEWNKVLKGVYTGFSIGGSYVKKWNDDMAKDMKRYTASPSEISIVDRPCVPSAEFFEVRKADGSIENVQFAPEVQEDPAPEAKPEAPDGLVEKNDAAPDPAPESKDDSEAPDGLEVKGSSNDLSKLASIMHEHDIDLASVVGTVEKYVQAKEIGERLEKGFYEVSEVAELASDLKCMMEWASYSGEGAPYQTAVAAVIELLMSLISAESDKLSAMKSDGFLPKTEVEELMRKAFSEPSKEQKAKMTEIAKAYLIAVEPEPEKKAEPDQVDLAGLSKMDDLVNLIKGLEQRNTAMAERLEKLEKSPAPDRIRLVVVDRGTDPQEKEVQPVTKHDGSIDAAATAIKKMHASGGRPFVDVNPQKS